MQSFHTIDVSEMCGEVVLSQGVILTAQCAPVAVLMSAVRCSGLLLLLQSGLDALRLSKPLAGHCRPRGSVRLLLRSLLRLLVLLLQLLRHLLLQLRWQRNGLG